LEDICSYALDLGLERSSYVEVKAERSLSNEFVIKNGKPETSGFDSSYGISIRVLVDGALGFCATNELDRDNVKKMVDYACRMAKAASRLIKKPIVFSTEGDHTDVNYTVKEKISLSDVSPEEKMEVLFEVHKSIPDEVDLAGNLMQLEDSRKEKYYVNSEGSNIRSIIPIISFFGFLTVNEGGDSAQAMLEKGASMGWEAIREWDLPSYVSGETTTLKNVLGKGQKPPKGSMDILCGPEVTGIASHESCGHPYEADRILGREAAQAGESFVSLDMLGTRIGSEIVTLVDDPTIENSFGFYLYDDEGVKARCNNYDREPIVRMANTFVEPGDWKRDEIIEETKRGILINSFTEWNIDDRRYNQKYVSREAYYIEDGEISYPVKKAPLEITTPRFWSSVDAIADDLGFFAGNCGKGEPIQGIPVLMGGPTIRLHDIELGVSL